MRNFHGSRCDHSERLRAMVRKRLRMVVLGRTPCNQFSIKGLTHSSAYFSCHESNTGRGPHPSGFDKAGAVF